MYLRLKISIKGFFIAGKFIQSFRVSQQRWEEDERSRKKERKGRPIIEYYISLAEGSWKLESRIKYNVLPYCRIYTKPTESFNIMPELQPSLISPLVVINYTKNYLFL